MQSSTGSGPMGCGSSYDSRQHETSSSPPAANCDMCGTRFSFISRKRTCADCGNVFCSTCLPSDRTISSKMRTCERCGVLNKKPPHRGELMKLRVKDLQHFLNRKRINIKSCVGMQPFKIFPLISSEKILNCLISPSDNSIHFRQNSVKGLEAG